MKKILSVLFIVITSTCFASSISNSIKFKDYFINRGLRIDFSLEGDFTYQEVKLIQIREEKVWGGVRKNLIEKLNYGNYLIKVYNESDRELIYSRGFNTLFGEWRKTKQAKNEVQKWINSISIPCPKNNVVIEIYGRNLSDMQFKILWLINLDLKAGMVDKIPLKYNKIVKIMSNGDPKKKVDLVFLGDGYKANEQEKFISDAKKFTKALFTYKPFIKYKKSFNVWAVEVSSKNGISDVSLDEKKKETAFNSSFNTFNFPKYLTCKDVTPIKDALWQTPCDVVFVLVNTKRYGGSGIYNNYAMGSSDDSLNVKVFVHGLGRAFAGLADEYEHGNPQYSAKLEPWEPNITTLIEFEDEKKDWYEKLDKKTPVPTPLNDKYKDAVGLFEGAGYVSKGVYRPAVHCMMRDLYPFCPVCQDAIIKMIKYYTDKKY